LREGLTLPPGDPIRAYARKTTAARQVGEGNKCTCGEDRPEALVPGSNPTECYRCERIRLGKAPKDQHHVAGKANNPTVISVPVNDHRAELSPAQYDWPKATLENRDGSPLLARAAGIRGFVDTEIYLIKALLLPNAEMLEILDEDLKNKLGPKWWENTRLAQFAPKPKRDADP
jgi:hypothetical protein